MNDRYLVGDIGGQLGSMVATRIPQGMLGTSLVAVLTLGQVIL